MKIALVHDYIKEYGGAERVLEALHEIWPDAPVYTSVYLPEFLGPHKERFKNWNIKTSFLQFLPFKEKLISPIRLIASFVFKSFDFSKYDVIIVSSTGAYVKKFKIQNSKFKSTTQNSKFDQRPIHVCYCHTPPRYLYGFATAREWKKNILFRAMGEVVNHFLRLVDFKSSQNVDYFIANSKNVAERIKKFYRRESTVIYPPVELNQESRMRNQEKKDYFLTGGRIAKPKHIGLVVQTFEKLNLPLVVFGREFPGSGKLKTQKSKVRLVGEVSDEEKMDLMRGAKAYIFAGEDEDFGITPVEAMSVGAPVVAYRSGGVIESVIEEKTGLFFDELTVNSLSRAIAQLNNRIIRRADCIRQAEKFSKERFKREMKDFVTKKLG